MYLSELTLYHYRARGYHPGIGRFLQTDPIGYEDQINLYSYVGNDPMNYTDPTGMYEYDEKTGVVTMTVGKGNMTMTTSGMDHSDVMSSSQENQQSQNTIVAEGDALLTTAGESAASGMNLTMKLRAYNGDRTMWTGFTISTNAVVAGLELGATPISQTNFSVLLEGPPLNSIDPYSLKSAFDGQILNYSSFTFSVGAGMSFGSLTIGDYSDPRSAVGVWGFDIGWTGFKGTAHVGDKFSHGYIYP